MYAQYRIGQVSIACHNNYEFGFLNYLVYLRNYIIVTVNIGSKLCLQQMLAIALPLITMLVKVCNVIIKIISKSKPVMEI